MELQVIIVTLSDQALLQSLHTVYLISDIKLQLHYERQYRQLLVFVDWESLLSRALETSDNSFIIYFTETCCI